MLRSHGVIYLQRDLLKNFFPPLKWNWNQQWTSLRAFPKLLLWKKGENNDFFQNGNNLKIAGKNILPFTFFTEMCVYVCSMVKVKNWDGSSSFNFPWRILCEKNRDRDDAGLFLFVGVYCWSNFNFDPPPKKKKNLKTPVDIYILFKSSLLLSIIFAVFDIASTLAANSRKNEDL